jgi:hypothetical protein
MAMLWYFDTEGTQSLGNTDIPGCIQKFPDRVHNEINNSKHWLRSNTKGYGGKTH